MAVVVLRRTTPRGGDSPHKCRAQPPGVLECHIRDDRWKGVQFLSMNQSHLRGGDGGGDLDLDLDLRLDLDPDILGM